MYPTLSKRALARPQLVVIGLLWAGGWIATAVVYPRVYGGLVSLVYVQTFIGFTVALLGLRCPDVALLSPSFLTIAYTCTSYSLGAWAFETSNVLLKKDLADYARWNTYRFTTVYYLIGLVLVFVMLATQMRAFDSDRPLYKARYRVSADKYVLLLVLFAIFTQVDLRLDFLGASGSFSFIALSLLALMIPKLLVRRSLLVRVGAYAVVVLVFAALFFNNKRQVFVVLLGLIIYDVAAVREPLGKRFLAALFILGVGLMSLVAMSIMRGYAGLDATDLVSAVGNMRKYVYNPLFIPMLMNNIEASYSFFNSYQGIEYVKAGKSHLLFGATIVKVLFLPVPRAVAPWKPVSIIHVYTMIRDPAFRNVGGSWPIHLLSELFWNFGVVGLSLLVPIFGFFNSVYLRLIERIRSRKPIQVWQLFLVSYFLIYVRGSGLDLYVLYIVIAFLVDRYLIEWCLSRRLVLGPRGRNVA